MTMIHDLSRKHEADIHALLGGHAAKGSGNQFNDQGDGRRSRYSNRFGFCWDAKAAMPGTKSLSISRDMVTKIDHQAHGERILLPLRFYQTGRGEVWRDLITLDLHDFIEILEATE